MSRGRGMKSLEEDDRGAKKTWARHALLRGLVCAARPLPGLAPWDSVLIQASAFSRSHSCSLEGIHHSLVLPSL